jgi:hypothetical protein
MPLDQLTLFAVGSHARTSLSPEDVRALLESGLDFGSSSIEFLKLLGRAGVLSKTSPACTPLMKAGTLPSSFEGWKNSGITLPGGFWTLNTSEFPKGATASSLSEVLETTVASRYYLSPKACAGILRRAAKRGRALPPALLTALEAVVRHAEKA